MSQLRDFVTSKNYAFTPVFDGILHRFDRNGNNNGWFVGKEYGEGEKKITLLTFGDWKLDEQFTYREEGVGLTPSDKENFEKYLNEQRALESLAKEKRWEQVSGECEKEFLGFIDRGRTPYLDKKQIQELYGARIKPNENGPPILVVPMRDLQGKIWNYQCILGEKGPKGDKFFHEGARIEGCFHLLENRIPVGRENRGALPEKISEILVAEGFATAASIQTAFPEKTVVTSFNAGNLLPVCQQLRQRYPDATITLCADNDAFTQKNGRPWNVGIEKGRLAAAAIQGKCVWPVFQTPREGDTDFNDLHIREGLGAVKDQLTHPEKYVQGIRPLTLGYTRKGEKIPPSEKEVADALLHFFKDQILKQGRDLFIYHEGYWRCLEVEEHDVLKQKIGILSDGTYGYREITNAFNYFFTHVKAKPQNIDFFVPNPNCANFNNGTLHFIRNSNATYHLEFKEHRKEDYLTSKLPFDYLPENNEKNEEFEKMLDRIWHGDPDLLDKKKLLSQIYGAALIPLFPTIVFFQGRPLTGKSTLLKIMARLVDKQNICDVQPHEFEGFNMEGMIGKLVNMNTDIETNEPIKDSVMKRIIDRKTFRVRRKNRKDVDACIPSLHAFGCNELPKTKDGKSGAYGHRILVLVTEKFQPVGVYDREFDQWLWEQGSQGIINFALRGLRELAEARGHYHVPESSKEKVIEFQEESDIVAQFLRALEQGIKLEGSDRVFKGENTEIAKSELWEIFKQWQKEEFQNYQFSGRNRFYKAMRHKNIAQRHTEKGDYYFGVGRQLIGIG